MGVQVRGIIAARGTAVRSLRQVIAPKRLSRRIRQEGRPFEPALLFPLLVIVLDSVTAVFTPHLQFYRLIGAAPALAAAMFSVAGTLGIGLLALMAGFAISAADHNLSRAPGHFTLLAITVVTLAAAYASRVRQNREHTLAEVRSVAETAQRVLLRPVPHHLGHIDVEVLYQAAAAQARIGGDFYEAIQTPHGVRLIIGDVRGKGLPAVEVASVILSTFRVLRMSAPDLPSLAGQMETVMSHYSGNGPDDALEPFATIVLVEIPTGEPIARVLNCGHPAPLLLHGGEVREVEPSAPSPPINMTALLGDHYQVDTIPFTAGDRLGAPAGARAEGVPRFRGTPSDASLRLNNAQNYGAVYSAKLVGGVGGGGLAASVVGAWGYSGAYYLAGGIAFLSAVLTLFLRQPAAPKTGGGSVGPEAGGRAESSPAEATG